MPPVIALAVSGTSRTLGTISAATVSGSSAKQLRGRAREPVTQQEQARYSPNSRYQLRDCCGPGDVAGTCVGPADAQHNPQLT